LFVVGISCGALAVYVLGARVRDTYASRHYGAVRDVPASEVPRVGIVFGAGVVERARTTRFGVGMA